MPTKTERILSYLPSTFRALPKPTALFTVADAFGGELLQAENNLAALMLAHWVERADKGAELIDDLARFASLYGLAPRPEESVEEFREHLKRYVRTFLDGTTTVQGILRVTAEALGLRIADEYTEMDTWWSRKDDALVDTEPRGDDAASLLLGIDRADVAGEPARPASITGNVDLNNGADLRGASVLSIQVDAAAPVEIDLAAHVSALSAAKLEEIEEAINDILGSTVASSEGHHLKLTSPTTGPASRLEIRDVTGDAAPRLLGLLSLNYRGTDAKGAEVDGLVDLSGGVNLSETRYLRLLVDGKHLAEVDCAGTNPAASTLDEIRDAINNGLSMTITSHDGRFLKLISPTKGFNSSIAFLSPAAGDAKERLFGPVEPFTIGHDERPAQVLGARDLGNGVDLSARSVVRVQIDDQAQYTVDCAGEEPERTRLGEIVAAFNAKLGANVASHDGHFIRLTSPTTGPTSAITFELVSPDEDATGIIFGIGPRVFEGEAATRGRLTGTPDLFTGVDLGALHFIQVSVDGGPPLTVNLHKGVNDERRATLDEIRDAINDVLGPNIASHDDHHLTLASPTVGGSSRITIEPLLKTRRRRFVTRAFATDEAAQAIFGFFTRQAQGEEATRARVAGTVDLSRGVDLRDERFLRLTVDDAEAVDIDCAGMRPRATLISEVVEKINNAVKADAGHEVASSTPDGKYLLLASPSSGASSRIAFEPPRADDALDTLLGLEPETFSGRSATRVSFVGTVDLSAGVDLSAADRIKINIDGQTFEIACAGADPAHTKLSEIKSAINTGVGAAVASDDGSHIILTSPSIGINSRVGFAVPTDHDATRLIFGIRPPRSYHGTDAAPARAVGVRDLHAGADLSVARFLRLALDGGQPVDVDCAAQAGADKSHVPLGQIVTTINEALNAANAPGIATQDGAHLILSTTTHGTNARLDLLPHPSGDARLRLFDVVKDVTTGSDPTPASITGVVDLLTPVNLEGQSFLRLSVDGGRPVDVNVAGVARATTFLDEIIARINEVFPQLASATEDDRLRLTSPTRGEKSSIELLPLRALELIEYPPVATAFPPADKPALSIRHGDRWAVRNDGVAEAALKIELSAPHGVAGPEFVNRTTGQRIRLMVVVRPGERADLWSDAEMKLHAAIIAIDGTPRPVPNSRILTGPLGPQTWVPFEGEWELSDGQDDDPATIQLNNPLAESVIVLRARASSPDAGRVRVSVIEASLSGQSGGAVSPEGQAVRLAGRVRASDNAYWLTDGTEKKLARLRAGSSVMLGEHVGRVVSVYGPLHTVEGPTPLMIVERIADLFDVTLRQVRGGGSPIVETYAGVAIGTGVEAHEEIVGQINDMTSPSQLVRAEESDKSAALILPRGRSQWSYLDCYGTRFNRAWFDTRFSGGLCAERAVFNISRFTRVPPGLEASVFASSGAITDPPVEIRFHWSRHQPGAFIVNLPADLPERFGGRFNQLRFAKAGDQPEEFRNVVTEPTTDPDYLITRLGESKLLKVNPQPVGRVPIGFEAAVMPFRRPRFLTGGTDTRPARIFLAEKDVEGFIEVSAFEPGAWGNSIALAARKAGPARFDVTVSYQAARFENARRVALGGAELPALAQDILRPGPVGILQAKAAGVHVKVSRDRADDGD
jgi:hypothetical protein